MVVTLALRYELAIVAHPLSRRSSREQISRFETMLLPCSGEGDAPMIVSFIRNPEAAHLSNFLIDSMPVRSRQHSWAYGDVT